MQIPMGNLTTDHKGYTSQLISASLLLLFSIIIQMFLNTMTTISMIISSSLSAVEIVVVAEQQ